jgi:hypothetical protein
MPGAELILAAIAFPIAIYETVEKFYKFGTFVAAKINKVKDEYLTKEVRNIREHMESLADGDMKRNMERTEWIFENKEIQKGLKIEVSDTLQKLCATLKTVGVFCDKCFEDNGEFHKKTYVWLYESKVRNALNAINTWEKDFWQLLQRISTESSLPDVNLLQKAKFADQPSQWNESFDATCAARFGCAEYEEKSVRQDILVLIECIQTLGKDGLPPLPPNTTHMPESERKDLADEAKIIVRSLKDYLQKTTKGLATTGILRCLGWRESPNVELIFEVPRGYKNPVTMRQLLIHARGGTNKDILAPWDFRYRVARQIVFAIYAVNSADYVHKNLRPSSIVLFSKASSSQNNQTTPANPTPITAQTAVTTNFSELSSAYLTDWRMLRQADTASHKQGTDNDWTRNFYRHPGRQGLKPQERYNTSHDVYSLGVCLLEIGLWESFIVEETIPTTAANNNTGGGSGRGTGTTTILGLSSYFLSAAQEHANRPRSFFIDETALNDPDRKYRKMGPLCASKNKELIDVFSAIAEARLPMHMGHEYTQKVVRCLRNIEGGFAADPIVFVGKDAADHFKRLMLGED